jgi:hypothetical protein
MTAAVYMLVPLHPEYLYFIISIAVIAAKGLRREEIFYDKF